MNKILMFFVMLFISGSCFAADTVNLNLKDVSAKVAIETLFKSSGKNYAIANVTNSMITVSITDVSFDVALKNIVKAAGMTYKIDGDIYMFDIKQNVVISPVVVPAAVVTVKTEIPKSKSNIEKVTLYYAGPNEILDYIGFGNNNSNSNSSYNNNSSYNSNNNRNR